MQNWFKRKDVIRDVAVPKDQCNPNSIVFRIKTMKFIDRIKEQNVTVGNLPAGYPLCGDLIVTFAYDLPSTFVTVNQTDVERLDISETMYGIAMNNLQKSLTNIQFSEQEGIFHVVTGNDMEACLLLVPNFWDQMQAKVEGEIIVAVPHRSKVLYCGSVDQNKVQIMHMAAVAIYEERTDNHGLSTSLFVYRNNSWELYRTAEEGGYTGPGTD